MRNIFCRNQGQVPPKETVKCSECFCLLEKSDAQRITGIGFLDRYYCHAHRRPYDIAGYISASCHDVGCADPGEQPWHTLFRYLKIIPAHEIEVDINGREIKKKSKK
jgi:hypothetical protein